VTKQKSIGSKSRHAFVWGLLGTLARQGTTVVITMILARLLGPEEFGLIGIALVFISLCQVFIDVGFTDGLIQKKDASEIIYSSIFYLNLAISLVLALLVFFAAPFIGEFYERMELPQVLRWLVIIVPIAAIGKVHETQLRKELKFKSLTIRTVVSSNVGGVIGIVAAYQGYGIYALVFQQLSTVVVSTVLLWISTQWKPSAAFSWTEVKSMFSFSGFVFLDQGIRQLFQRIDVLFIGKVFSPTVLGYYSRAESLNFQITTYTSGIMRKVMYPVLSTVQDNEQEFERIFLKVFSLLAVASCGLLGVVYFVADDLVLLLLGDQWKPAIVLFQILIFKTLISPFGVLMGKSLLSRGYSKERFYFGLMNRLIMLLPLVVGFFTDVVTFALVVVVTFFITFLIQAYAVDKIIHIRFRKQVVLFFGPLVPLLTAIFVKMALSIALPSIVEATIFALFFVVYLHVTKDAGYLHALYEIRRVLTKRKQPRSSV
jgi:O-antigen/teichoic acid export membrane protein